jgi:hypothetical protein
MPLSELDRKSVEAFREYVEGSVAADDRYGPVSRHDTEDWSDLATRFEVGRSCWLEVTLRPLVPQIRVGFVTDDPAVNEEVGQALQDSEHTTEALIASAFEDAGLDWADPVVEHGSVGGEYFYFATPLEIEDTLDFDSERIRDTTVRMLEGYLIVFGPATAVEEED